MTRKLSVLLILTLLVTGCAHGRAFRHGQDGIRRSDWDAAVAYFTSALQGAPDNGEYKINLQRAQEEASRMHIERARELEQKDQLDQALSEYKKALTLMG